MLHGIISNSDINISAWNIKVNNQDIINSSDITSTIELTVPETNYCKEGYLVPGAIGYFDIDVDGSNVNLPYKYTVTSVLSEDNEIADLKIIGYSVDNGNTINYLKELNTNVELNVQANTDSIARVYVQWNDDTSTQTLNDVADTTLAREEAIGSIDVTIRFEQRN